MSIYDVKRHARESSLAISALGHKLSDVSASSWAAIMSKFSLRRLPAAGLRTQRRSLAPLVTEEPWLADPHSGMSGARSGRPEIPAHRDGSDPFFVDLPKDRCLMVDYFIAPSYQARR